MRSSPSPLSTQCTPPCPEHQPQFRPGSRASALRSPGPGVRVLLTRSPRALRPLLHPAPSPGHDAQLRVTYRTALGPPSSEGFSSVIPTRLPCPQAPQPSASDPPRASEKHPGPRSCRPAAPSMGKVRRLGPHTPQHTPLTSFRSGLPGHTPPSSGFF